MSRIKLLHSYIAKLFKNKKQHNNITIQQSNNGFTLIELLVVISIIGLLTAVATVSYTNVQKKSRDGKRKSDLAAIQQALEQFRTVNDFFPDEDSTAADYTLNPPRETDRISCTVDGSNSDSNTFGYDFICDANAATGAIAQSYMVKLPADPRTTPLANPTDNTYGGARYRYIYEVYEVDRDSSGYSGWCETTEGGKCRHYTLWAGLENANDPDIAKTNNDQICQLSITYETPSYGSDFGKWAAPNNVPFNGISHSAYTGWANYCVHD